MSGLTGIFIPAVTPFGPYGDVQLASIAKNMERWCATAISGVMALGSNGEAKSLTDRESLDVIRTFSMCKGDKTLVAGIGRESTYATLRLLEGVVRDAPGVDYVAILTPSYYAGYMDDVALGEYYTAIADRSPFPVVIYAAPKFANRVAPSAALVGVLSMHPNIAGIKDTTSGMMRDYLTAGAPSASFSVLSGSIETLGTCLDGGGAGGVLSIANYAPERCANVTKLYWDGYPKEAFEELEILRRVASAASGPYAVSGVKACMNACGYSAGIPRPPLSPVTGSKLTSLQSALKEYDMLGSGSRHVWPF